MDVEAEDEAFLAMSRFLWTFANRSGNDLFGLLDDIHIEADGRPTDPAGWEDWIASVRAVKEEADREPHTRPPSATP